MKRNGSGWLNAGKSSLQKLPNALGMRIDPHVSEPQPTAAKLAAIAAPVPPLEPPGQRAGSYGLRVCPPNELTLVIPAASSCRLDLARMIAPASRSFLMTNASVDGWLLANASEPPLVGMSNVSKLSLTMTGMPCSAPRDRPA